MELFNGLAQHRQRVEIVNRKLEKTLNLRGVKVERHHAVGSRRFDSVRTNAGANRDARFVFFIPFGVAEVRHEDSDRLGARTPEGVDPKEQLHKIIVGGERRGLDEVDVTAPDILENPDEQRALGKLQQFT